MPPETTKFDIQVPVDLLTNFDAAVKKETGMMHGRAAKIRALMREYITKQGAA